MSRHRNALTALLAVTGALCAAPHSQASPDTDAQDAMAGNYRLVLSTGEERTWNITAGCASVTTDPCVTVVGNGRAKLEATLSGGRWSYQLPYGASSGCDNPPVRYSTWSWDPATLAGTVVHHIAGGCGQVERDETYATLTLTRLG